MRNAERRRQKRCQTGFLPFQSPPIVLPQRQLPGGGASLRFLRWCLFASGCPSGGGALEVSFNPGRLRARQVCRAPFPPLRKGSHHPSHPGTGSPAEVQRSLFQHSEILLGLGESHSVRRGGKGEGKEGMCFPWQQNLIFNCLWAQGVLFSGFMGLVFVFCFFARFVFRYFF